MIPKGCDGTRSADLEPRRLPYGTRAWRHQERNECPGAGAGRSMLRRAGERPVTEVNLPRR